MLFMAAGLTATLPSTLPDETRPKTMSAAAPMTVIRLATPEDGPPIGVGYKHGAWHDVGWFERFLAPRVVDPPSPRAFAECRGEAEFHGALETGRAYLR